MGGPLPLGRIQSIFADVRVSKRGVCVLLLALIKRLQKTAWPTDVHFEYLRNFKLWFAESIY